MPDQWVAHKEQLFWPCGINRFSPFLCIHFPLPVKWHGQHLFEKHVLFPPASRFPLFEIRRFGCAIKSLDGLPFLAFYPNPGKECEYMFPYCIVPEIKTGLFPFALKIPFHRSLQAVQEYLHFCPYGQDPPAFSHPFSKQNTSAVFDRLCLSYFPKQTETALL